MGSPEFLTFGNRRIKRKNIKTYGLHQINAVRVIISVYTAREVIESGFLFDTKSLIVQFDKNVSITFDYGKGFNNMSDSDKRNAILRAINGRDGFWIYELQKSVTSVNSMGNPSKRYEGRGMYLVVGDQASFEVLKKYHYGWRRDENKQITFTFKGNQKIDALYINTYQGDQYRFRQDRVSFNVREKLAELDKILS